MMRKNMKTVNPKMDNLLKQRPRQVLPPIANHYPTQYSSPYPTQHSSPYPTQHPNQYSSQHPTQYSSQHPTQYPSQYPSQHPSQHPTQYSSQHPTQYPSQYPSQHPSLHPSQYRRSNGILVDSVTELNEMVEQMGSMKLDKTPEATNEPQPSVSTERQRPPPPTASSSTMDISDEQGAVKAETTLSWTLELAFNLGNSFATIRGALESDSRFNLITEKCRRKLKLPLLKLGVHVPESVHSSRKILGRTIISFSSYFNKKRVFTMEAIVVDKICRRSPSMIIHPSIKQQLDFFKLADPNFDIPAGVDLVVGSELYSSLIKGRPCFVLGKSCSVLQSLLGWVIGGRVPIDEFQTNKTKDDAYQKLMKTVRDVEQFMRKVTPNR